MTNPASISSYSKLNKVSKTLIRSILRWTKLSHVQSTPFQLNLNPNHNYFLEYLPKDENNNENDKNIILINSPLKLRQSLCYFCRSFPSHSIKSSTEWCESIN